MDIRAQLKDKLNAALKAKDNLTSSTIRLILAALKDRDIAARTSGKPIEDQDILAMLQSMIKQRSESMALYKKGGRDDLMAQEKGEIEVISQFLPTQMTAEEIEAAVNIVIEKMQPNGIKDMGNVMSALRGDYAGRMDFKIASELVKHKLK